MEEEIYTRLESGLATRCIYSAAGSIIGALRYSSGWIDSQRRIFASILLRHPAKGDMPLHCFELYGVMGVVERAEAEKALKDRKRFARRRVAQVLSSNDELSDEESFASNRV
ncbi:hypothetical protein Dimus_037484 [Dionaea muscipula]